MIKGSRATRPQRAAGAQSVCDFFSYSARFAVIAGNTPTIR